MPFRAGIGEVPDDILLELGRMTVAFASLDASLNVWISFFLLPKADGAELSASNLVTAQMSFISKIRLFANLYLFMLGGHRGQELDAILGRLRFATTERNKYPHERLSHSSAEGKVSLYKLRINRSLGYAVG